jgi:hypothetical protein
MIPHSEAYCCSQHDISVLNSLFYRKFCPLVFKRFQETVQYGNIVLTTTIGRRVWYHLCLLLLVRQADYIVNLSDFYSYRLIGKLTVFLQLQEFSLRKPTVVSSTSVSREKLAWLSLRLQLYLLCDLFPFKSFYGPSY